MKKFVEGILILIKILKGIIRLICKNFENLLELFKHKREKEAGIPACCIKVPDDKRPRPDPYIYCQDWLLKRGFAVTWQNPDFIIFDMGGNQIASDKLLPNSKYRIVVTIHNNSPMAALNTKVNLTINSFGIQTGIIWGSPANTLDIPPVGSNTTDFIWETPNETGHICLIATIFHIDDANTLNNIGQHNTTIVGEDTKTLSFKVNNFSSTKQKVFFYFDTYSLPLEPLRPSSAEEMKSQEYLKKLQRLNSIYSNSIHQINILKGFENEIELEPDTELEVEINKSFFTNNSTLNITAFSNNQVFLGGVTFIKPN